MRPDIHRMRSGHGERHQHELASSGGRIPDGCWSISRSSSNTNRSARACRVRSISVGRSAAISDGDPAISSSLTSVVTSKCASYTSRKKRRSIAWRIRRLERSEGIPAVRLQ